MRINNLNRMRRMQSSNKLFKFYLASWELACQTRVYCSYDW